MPLKFKSGTNVLIYGVSGSDKSTFVLEVIRRKLLTVFPDKVYYFYKVHQPFMKSWNLQKNCPKITFIEGIDLSYIEQGNCLAIFDDMLLEKQSKCLAEVFVFGSHHLNITVFFLTQTLYPKDEHYRLMALNAHYMVLFGDMRSLRQVNTLANQLFMHEDKARLINAFRSSINRAYGFVVLNFVKNIPRELTVITNFWSENPSVYL